MSKSKALSALSLGLVLALATAPAFAQTANEAQRDANQQQRIEQGEASGQLTPKEAGKLEKGEAKIDKVEAKASADGVVTPKEKRHIARMQNRESRRIEHKKHNAVTTAPAPVPSAQ